MTSPQSVLAAAKAWAVLQERGYAISRAKFYGMIGTGDIPSVKLPGCERFFVPISALDKIAPATFE